MSSAHVQKTKGAELWNRRVISKEGMAGAAAKCGTQPVLMARAASSPTSCAVFVPVLCHLNFALEQLRFDASLLERTSTFVSDNLVLIKQGGSPSWPAPAATATTLLAHKAKIQAALERDVEHLMARCERLARSCELSTLLVSSMQLIESQKGIVQAGQVQCLTQLAFLFIPISLLAAVFGMNVAEYKNPPNIWVFFLIAAVLFGVTCFMLSRQVWMRQVRRLRRHMLGGRAHVT